MRRIFALLISLALITGLATAVVGHNGSDGDVSITSGGSSTATTTVTENETGYTAKVEMTGLSQNQTDNEIRNISYTDHQKVEFNGTITAGTPCHVIDQEVNETGEDSYIMNVKTVSDNSSEACADVVTGINYEADFEADSGFQLEVRHDNETIETLEDRVVEPEPEPSLIQRLLNFLGL